jgi:hypothetical protein
VIEDAAFNARWPPAPRDIAPANWVIARRDKPPVFSGLGNR